MKYEKVLLEYCHFQKEVGTYVKKLLIVLGGLFILLSFSKVDVIAEDDEKVFQSGVYTYALNEDGSIRIVGYTGNEEVVNIPSEIEGRPVTLIVRLGQYRRYDEPLPEFRNDRTKKIIVPDGIKEIMGCDECINVEEVILPESVTCIGENTFNQCKKLKKIQMSKNLKTIEHAAFGSCTNLKSIILPKGLKTIGWGAFAGCSALKEIKIPDTVEEIGSEAFALCTNLRKAKLSKNMTTIESSLFYLCFKLKSVQLPQKLKVIKEEAFCSTAIADVTIPKNVTKIYWHAFGSDNLKHVTIKSTKIKYIGTKAFYTNGKVVYDVPNNRIKKYKSLLKKNKCFVEGKSRIK